MPRRVCWLERLTEIRRSVENSVRSHYTRAELQALFKLQKSAAQDLIALLPTVRVDRSKLVERAVLLSFLDQVREAEDVSDVIQMRRTEREAASRKRPRHLVRRDLDPVELASLPNWIRVREGRLEIDFQTTEQLGEGMLMLARILESDGEEFARRFEPDRPAPDPGGVEVAAMFRDLEQREAAYGRTH